jgi:glycosyltransferase involved in cell wall biosynthesis
MRILVVTPTFLPAWGGAERLLLEVFSRLAGRHTIHLVAPNTPEAAVRENAASMMGSLPFSVSRYDEGFRGDRVRGRRFHRGFVPPFDVAAVSVVSKATRDFAPDVLSVFYAIPMGLAGLAAKHRYRVPMVLSLVGRDVPGPATLPGWKFFVQRVSCASDRTTYISDYSRTALFGERGKGVVVGSGAQQYPVATTQGVDSLREQLGLPGDVFVLFALQRLSVYKGVDVIIEAMTHLKDLPCVLLVAGTGPDKPRLEAAIRERGLQDKVRLLGFVDEDDLSRYWALADLFVFHSYYETFGMVLAEAMLAGKAVVSVRNTAIPEVVRDGQDGLLVEPGDAVALAVAMRQLIGDAERRRTMAESGHARAEQEFDWERVARAYETVFEDAIRSKQ